MPRIMHSLWKKIGLFFCRHRMTGGKVRFFRWETGGRNPKNGGENVENTTPSSGLRFYPFSFGYPVVFHRFSTRFSTPVSAWKKHISGARFRFRGRWRRVRKGSMEDGRRRGTGERNVPFRCVRSVLFMFPCGRAVFRKGGLEKTKVRIEKTEGGLEKTEVRRGMKAAAKDRGRKMQLQKKSSSDGNVRNCLC